MDSWNASLDSCNFLSFLDSCVHTIVHILNRGILISNNDKTLYNLWKGIPMNVKNFKVFGRKCYIKRKYDMLGKFDSQADKGMLVEYSSKTKAYKCFNSRLNIIMESINVMIDKTDLWKGK
jgi:hypothetical protein